MVAKRGAPEYDNYVREGVLRGGSWIYYFDFCTKKFLNGEKERYRLEHVLAETRWRRRYKVDRSEKKVVCFVPLIINTRHHHPSRVMMCVYI